MNIKKPVTLAVHTGTEICEVFPSTTPHWGSGGTKQEPVKTSDMTISRMLSLEGPHIHIQSSNMPLRGAMMKK
jgi:hypothetical protein